MNQPSTIEEYRELAFKIDKLDPVEKVGICRWLARTDLYFLLWFICGRKDIEHPWLLARCKEVQDNPDGRLDLWARGHYKSTIITFGKTIQDILSSHGDDPLPQWNGIEQTFAIFSHTRPIAIKFLGQIKMELESNPLLKSLFPDVLYETPHKEAKKWSEQSGIIVKRKSNPKESTIEAYGVVEGQPTGIHPTVMIYDDMVTLESVGSPNMIEKTTTHWKISLNLAVEHSKLRYIGTFYDFNDTYHQMIKAGSAVPRIYPATDDGEATGNPVLLSREALNNKHRDMGPYVFACQMLLNPIADSTIAFKKDWLRWHGGIDTLNGNKYILVDPANVKNDDSDYTAIIVIDLGEDENYRVVDMVRDRINIRERVDMLFRLHKKWRPLGVGYEDYKAEVDFVYIQEKMQKESYFFDIVKLRAPVGMGRKDKKFRIERLIPSFSQGRWYFPDSIFKTNYEGKYQDLVEVFINEEYLKFPVPVHDDMLDCMAYILHPDMNVIWPRGEDNDRDDRYTAKRSQGSSWAS